MHTVPCKEAIYNIVFIQRTCRYVAYCICTVWMDRQTRQTDGQTNECPQFKVINLDMAMTIKLQI